MKLEVPMFRKAALTLFVLIGGLFLAACAAPATPASPAPQPNSPNPASVFCEAHGGTVEIRQEAAGGQYGMCVFPDKSECEEWAFYHEECQPGAAMPMPGTNAGIANPASAYCEGHGGTLEIRPDASGGLSGGCVFSDQTQCEEWAYFRGECLPGTATP
jgi:putative hemolysin